MKNYLLPGTCIWLSRNHTCLLPDHCRCPEVENPITGNMPCEHTKEDWDCIIEAMRGEFLEEAI